MSPTASFHTVEDATPAELRAASVRLLISLLALAILTFTLIRELPLGMTGRTGVLAWLLVGAALYWLWAGQGIRPLLIIQLLLFSTAATLLTAKAFLVGVGIHRLSILRRTSYGLIISGAVCAAVNLFAMFTVLAGRWRRLEQS